MSLSIIKISDLNCLTGQTKSDIAKRVLNATHLSLVQGMYVVWQCLSGTSGPNSSTVYEHISLLGFLAGTFLKVGRKIFLVICWSFCYPTCKSPTLVLVDDIFCLLHTLNFGKVFFCLGVCIIPTKECFFETFGSPSKLCLYSHFQSPSKLCLYSHFWSTCKLCLYLKSQ